MTAIGSRFRYDSRDTTDFITIMVIGTYSLKFYTSGEMQCISNWDFHWKAVRKVNDESI